MSGQTEITRWDVFRARCRIAWYFAHRGSREFGATLVIAFVAAGVIVSALAVWLIAWALAAKSLGLVC